MSIEAAEKRDLDGRDEAHRIETVRDELIQDMLRDEVAVVHAGLHTYSENIDQVTGPVIEANPDYIELLLIALARRDFSDYSSDRNKGRIELDRILGVLSDAMSNKLDEVCEKLAEREIGA